MSGLLIVNRQILAITILELGKIFGIMTRFYNLVSIMPTGPTPLILIMYMYSCIPLFSC